MLFFLFIFSYLLNNFAEKEMQGREKTPISEYKTQYKTIFLEETIFKNHFENLNFFY